MRKIIAILFSFSLFPSPVWAGDPIGGGGFEKDGKSHKDFEVTLSSDVSLTINSSDLQINQQSIGGAQVTYSNGHQTATLTWTHDLPADASVGYDWGGYEQNKNQYTQKARYTPPDDPTDLPSLGINVTSSHEVFLTNAYATAIDFSNLLFQFPTGIPSGSLLGLILAGSGIPGLVTSGTVAGNSELLVADFPSLPFGFLTGTYDSTFDDPSFSPLAYEGVVAHGTPELSTWAMMLIGAAGIMLAGYRRTRVTISAA
jgi:hypothetical protein